MKSKKLLAAFLIASMGLLGAGYALWTESLNFATNISTATMDMTTSNAQIANEADPLNQLGDDDLTANTIAGGVESKSADDTGFSWGISNLYPGAIAKVTVDVQNTGTISTKLANATVSSGLPDATGIIYDVSAGTATFTNVAGSDLKTAIQSCLSGTWAPNELRTLTIKVKVKDDGTGTFKEATVDNMTVTLTWDQANKPEA